MPIVDVPKKDTKVAGTRGTSRRLVETVAGAYAPTPPDRASTSRSAPFIARASTSGSAPSQAPRERAPNATSQHRWGGSTPNHSASGMRMGFKPPEQHHTTHSTNKRERTQVRLAARVVHWGGFGTCVPGAWSGHATQTTRRTRHGSMPSHKPPAPECNPRAGIHNRMKQPRSPGRTSPGIKLREHGLNVP